MSNIYLDYAAATPLDRRVMLAMRPYFSNNFYNPSGLSVESDAVRRDIESARETVARILGVKTSEIIFTAGCTEANNLAIRGVMEKYSRANVVISAIEHDSVLAPAGLYDNKQVPVGQDAVVDIDRLVSLIDDNTVLVSVILANNEVGSIQPLQKISQRLADIKKQRTASGNKLPLLFHTDAAQAGNCLSLQIDKLGVDLLSLNGGKIYGPKQSGVLFVRSSLSLRPLILGGLQESGLRAGTENPAGIVGFARALSIAQTGRVSEAQRLSDLTDLFIEQIRARLPKAIINGSLVNRLPGNVHLSIPGTDNERLIMELDLRGVIAAAGSACGALRDRPSHVLSAMSIGDDLIHSSLRFSMGRSTTAPKLKRVIELLVSLA